MLLKNQTGDKQQCSADFHSVFETLSFKYECAAISERWRMPCYLLTSLHESPKLRQVSGLCRTKQAHQTNQKNVVISPKGPDHSAGGFEVHE